MLSAARGGVYPLNFPACLYVSCRELYSDECVGCLYVLFLIEFRTLFVLSEFVIYHYVLVRDCGGTYAPDSHSVLVMFCIRSLSFCVL